MILSFQTDRPGQTVQTQKLEEQSDQGIMVYTVCNSVCIFWMHYSKVQPTCSTFRVFIANVSGSQFWGFLRYISLSQACLISPQLRNRLIALHPQNYGNLETIQKSAFVIALEDESPRDESDVRKLMSRSGGFVCWFYKCRVAPY